MDGFSMTNEVRTMVTRIAKQLAEKEFEKETGIAIPKELVQDSK